MLQALRNPTPAEDPDGWTTDQRAPVAVLLAKIGEPVDIIVPALGEALQGEIPAVRWGAACALAEMGAAAQPALEALAQTARDETEVETVRVEAAYALAAIGDPQSDTLPVLLTAAQSEEWWVRAFAARLLGELVETEERPVPELFDPMTRALMGMRKLPRLNEPPATLFTTLIHLLADPNYNVRRNAIAALANLTERATPAIPALVALLQQADVGPLAAEALAKVGAAAQPALQGAVASDDAATIRHAAYGLSLLAPTEGEPARGREETDSLSQRFIPTPHHFYARCRWSSIRLKLMLLRRSTRPRWRAARGSKSSTPWPIPNMNFYATWWSTKDCFCTAPARRTLMCSSPFATGSMPPIMAMSVASMPTKTRFVPSTLRWSTADAALARATAILI